MDSLSVYKWTGNKDMIVNMCFQYFQIPPEEYCQAIRQLMCETKFRCHIWCYNMPVAMVFFTLFLGLCLAIIPVIETKYMFSGTGKLEDLFSNLKRTNE